MAARGDDRFFPILVRVTETFHKLFTTFASKNAQIKLVLAIAKGRSLIRISVQKLDFRTEGKMINGSSVYDAGGSATTRPDFKAFFDRPTPTKIQGCLNIQLHYDPFT